MHHLWSFPLKASHTDSFPVVIRHALPVALHYGLPAPETSRTGCGRQTGQVRIQSAHCLAARYNNLLHKYWRFA